MSTLEELSLPRAVLVADTDGADAGLAAVALTAVLAATGTAVGSLRLSAGSAPVVRQAVTAVGGDHDVLIIDAAAGLLVPLDERGGTLADVGTALRYKGISTGAVLVTTGGLAAPNVLALSAEALTRRELPVIGVVVVRAAHADGEVTSPARLVAAAGAPLLAVLPGDLASDDPSSLGSQAAPAFSSDSWATMTP
ncbi:hypothetical protein ASG73_03750 [Janibacter sp. Soil728]|uniref:AAA family ATPase n=1 Tax=Janibacter sp. Soil728 TaxID=1736393 RepID=UPI0006FBA890|nr:AAA family ATPase [Janibacter sp. Soil728]KRE39445.1 hypothetical protein ASG73_03750 [Janibacter sp. Soil728]